MRVFACPDHAPSGFRPESYDDGRPLCSALDCAARNYAVKPYILNRELVERGWRTDTYLLVTVKPEILGR